MSDFVTLYTMPASMEKCLENTEKNGKQLYKTNKNYRTLANVMEHPEFRKFFDSNFKDWIDIKNIIMFLKIYQGIEKTSPVELNGYQKLSILDGIIKDSELRHSICNEVCESSNRLLNINYTK